MGTIAADAAREAHETGVDPREVAAALYVTAEPRGPAPVDEPARSAGACCARRSPRSSGRSAEIEADAPGLAPAPPARAQHRPGAARRRGARAGARSSCVAWPPSRRRKSTGWAWRGAERAADCSRGSACRPTTSKRAQPISDRSIASQDASRTRGGLSSIGASLLSSQWCSASRWSTSSYMVGGYLYRGRGAKLSTGNPPAPRTRSRSRSTTSTRVRRFPGRPTRRRDARDTQSEQNCFRMSRAVVSSGARLHREARAPRPERPLPGVTS